MLETRKCICGCEKTFRVMEGSSQKYASKACEFWHDGCKQDSWRSQARHKTPDAVTKLPTPKSEGDEE